MKSFFKIIIAVAVVITIALLANFQKPQTYVAEQMLQPKNRGATLGKPQNPETTFLAVGDIMLSRDVAAQMTRNGKDGAYPFKNIQDLLNSTDFNFGNLESPFSETDAQDPDPYTFIFNAPKWSIPGLVSANFKVLSLANNHALNQGKDGLMLTRQVLTQNLIESVGAGADPEQAWQGRVIETNEIKIGFIAATYGPESKYLAQLEDTDFMIDAINNLKVRSDFVVVAMHAGTEYEREPNWQQEKFARAAIDAGADMVIGAHPHWVQSIEQYKGKYIFYSLGNFVFDQSWSQDTKEGLTLKISLTKNDMQTMLKQVELVPIVIDNTQPRLATEAETQSILKKINVAKKVLK